MLPLIEMFYFTKYLLCHLLLLLLCEHMYGYPNGGPSTQCGSMVPGHGRTPQDTSNSPYEVKVR